MSEHPEIIFIKRRGGHEEAHHGGAWKIAFADFMTAMMTFFLVLWIINATDKNTKSVIARYFNPVHLDNPAKGHKGVHAEANVPDQNFKKDDIGAAIVASDDKNAEKTLTGTPSTEKPHPPKGEPEKSKAKSAEASEAPDPAHPKPTLPESALLADPYGSLDRIAGPPPPAEAAPSAAKASEAASESADEDSFRDPFAPSENFSKGAKALEGDSAQPRQMKAKSAEQAIKIAPATPPAASSLTPPSDATAPTTSSKEKSLSSMAKEILNELRTRMGKASLGPGPSIDVRATSEGVLISLTDQLNFSMFPVGSAEPQPQVVQAMTAVAQSLANHPGLVVIRGHTDGRPYHSQSYDNWRLSEARGQMAYYMLTRAHLDDKRVEHVEGYADRRLKNAANPYAAENRRIEILLRETTS